MSREGSFSKNIFGISEMLIGAITIVLSVVGSWVVIKQDMARFEQRLESIETNARRNVEVMEKLTDTLGMLQVTFAGFAVELKYLKEEARESKKGSD